LFSAPAPGRITVVGTVPDQELAAALARWLVREPVGGWRTDESVTASTSTDGTGNRLHVVHNWGWRQASATPPTGLKDLLSGQTCAAGEPVVLGPWDVRIFRS
jgi:beta-galactosidase